MVIQGPQPLILQRTYRSSDFAPGHLGIGWKLSEPNQLEVYSGFEGKHRSEFYATVTTSLGARARYQKLLKNTSTDKEEFNFGNNKGFTNCGSGAISGRTNLKNNKLVIQAKKPKEGFITGKLTGGDGKVRRYRYHYEDSRGMYHCELSTEEGRSNTRKHFMYYPSAYIHSVCSKNWAGTLNYGSFTFDRLDEEAMKEKKQVSVVSNLNHKIRYKFRKNTFHNDKQKYPIYFLENVLNPTRPVEEYRYVQSGSNKNHLLLSEKILPNSRGRQIEYYQKGDNSVNGNKIHIKHSDDPLVDRVKFLKAPVDQNTPTPILTHSFIYHLTKDKYDTIIGGATEVFDAYKNRTVYHYDKDYRLTHLIKHAGFGNVWTKEQFFWGENKSIHAGNLLTTCLSDPSGQIRKAKSFYYDVSGNIYELRDYGVHTGSNYIPIVMNADGRAANNSTEYVATRFKHDEHNRLLIEFSANGKTTHYQYLNDSDLVTCKLIKDPSNKIIFREQNHYDANFFLVTKIIDEGEGSSQKITRIQPRLAAPYGFPQIVNELYQEDGQEHLLHRTVNHHTAQGYLVAQEHYDSQGQLQYVLRWEYNDHGKVTKEINAIGQTFTKRYDDNDNLIWEQGPSSDCETHYIYDFSDRLTKITEYHADGHHLTTSHRYDYLGNRIATVDRNGNTTTYTYDAFGNMIHIEYPAVINENNELVAPVEQYVYDVLGHCEVSNKRGYRTVTKYNVNGKPLSIHCPDNTTESFFYNLDGTVNKSINKDGTFYLYHHDCLGKMLVKVLCSAQGVEIKRQEFTHSFNHILSETDEEGVQTFYEYDAADRLIAKTKGIQKTTYTYDTLSRIEKEIHWIKDNEAQVTAFKYDLLNRVLEESIQDLNGHVFESTQYSYNVHGQKTQVKIGDHLTQTFYNSRKEPIQSIDAEGHVTTIEYNYNFYNHVGQHVTLISTIDPLGKITEQEKDVAGQTFRETTYAADKTLLAQRTNFYTLQGDLGMVRHDRIIDGKIVDSVHHRWTFDQMRNLTSLMEAWKTPDQRTHTYQYNALGQKSAYIKPDGIILYYTYDEAGRLATTKSSDQSIQYQYQYDKKDRIIKCIDLNNQTETFRSYDYFDNLLQETLGNGLTLSFAYDAVNRKTSITLPDQSLVDYTYNSVNLISVSRWKDNQLQYTHTYDAYDACGNLLKSTLPFQAGTLKYVYDSLNRERQILHSTRKQEIPAGGFDAVGNLLYLQYSDSLGAVDCQYTYDPLYQLTSETGIESHQYKYDSVHNRIEIDQTSCEINSLNLLLSQEGLNYQYDSNGNRQAQNTTQYTYDAWNRLTSSTTNNVTTTYQYDAFHRRLSKNHET